MYMEHGQPAMMVRDELPLLLDFFPSLPSLLILKTAISLFLDLSEVQASDMNLDKCGEK